MKFSKWSAVVLVFVALVAAFALFDFSRATQLESMSIALLIPDEEAIDGPHAKLWADAAQEIGVHLQAVHDSEWVRARTRHHKAWEGVILPDTFHRKLPEGLHTELQTYVEQGGRLMLLYDAGLLNEKGFYSTSKTKLANLVGMEYGLYQELREGMTERGVISANSTIFEELGIPPGRYVPENISLQSNNKLFGKTAAPALLQVVGYGEEQQLFPNLLTRGKPNGSVLMQNNKGSVLASTHQTGKGETLFVNLPLTYLKQRSDGVFLHGFLGYFAKKTLKQPYLSESPDAKGVVVLNWHVDAKPAMPALKKLAEMNVFDEGPFSFHITAGPDVNTKGDGGGLDVPANDEVRQMLLSLKSKGHAIADHGGWIHNYFGSKANANNSDEMLPLIVQNHEAITKLIGQPPKEYSAPMGNQPIWASEWLEKNGFIATYLTGNMGMSPTKLWMGDKRITSMWTFPVLSLGRVATAEDAYFQNVTPDTFENWLLDVLRFIQEAHAVRLVYFHPPGAVLYATAVKSFVNAVSECKKKNLCQWMTMTQVAEFLNQREETDWRLIKRDKGWALKASHPKGLARLTWRIPAARFSKPKLIDGEATMSQDGDEWLVYAGSSRRIEIALEEKS